MRFVFALAPGQLVSELLFLTMSVQLPTLGWRGTVLHPGAGGVVKTLTGFPLAFFARASSGAKPVSPERKVPLSSSESCSPLCKARAEAMAGRCYHCTMTKNDSMNYDHDD